MNKEELELIEKLIALMIQLNNGGYMETSIEMEIEEVKEKLITNDT